MGVYLQILFFISKIHINEKLFSKCDRPLPIIWYYLYHKHCHMKISTQLRNTPFTGTHTVSNELLSTYTDCRWEVQKLGCPCFPSLGSKYKPRSKMEQDVEATQAPLDTLHTHTTWGHSKALLQSQRQGVSQREERDNIWIKMQSWRKRTDDQNSYTAERWWRTPQL